MVSSARACTCRGGDIPELYGNTTEYEYKEILYTEICGDLRRSTGLTTYGSHGVANIMRRKLEAKERSDEG